ncbi:MAG: hypothetical protein PHY48_01310 [Candidatus Cloacimonetes bacterium]|nr:hypothetical protein [Candidatus Cloacimonadota bacterium]
MNPNQYKPQRATYCETQQGKTEKITKSKRAKRVVNIQLNSEVNKEQRVKERKRKSEKERIEST